MLDNLKYLINFKSVDKDIIDKNYDLALEKLNALIQEEYRPAETFLKRGQVCHDLLMLDDAYSDFTYIITHCSNKTEAYRERASLNYEISNFIEAISDSDKMLTIEPENFQFQRIKFLSLTFLNKIDFAKEYILSIFKFNKYKTIQYILQEVATALIDNEFAKGLKLLEIIDTIDKDNPIKIFKEAAIYELIGNKEKQNELLNQIDSAFPKYFISHFRFSDMYQEKDLLEICFLLELKIFDKHNLFIYPMTILEGYKNYIEGHIIDSKENFEKAIEINPEKPEGYILLAQSLQLMSGYDSPEYMQQAIENYQKALDIYQKEKLMNKVEEMRRQIKHIKSGTQIYS